MLGTSRQFENSAQQLYCKYDSVIPSHRRVKRADMGVGGPEGGAPSSVAMLPQSVGILCYKLFTKTVNLSSQPIIN